MSPPQHPSTSINPASVERLVLTGFMGSGKTTVGALLAARLGWKFVDLDHEVERLEGMAVPRIFAEKGEPEFRRLESVALASLLLERRVVIALGGGAPEAMSNQSLLRQTARTAVVHLTGPFDTLVERCRKQVGGAERPVLADIDVARQRFAVRCKIYEDLADHSVDTTLLSPDETVEALLKMLSVPD